VFTHFPLTVAVACTRLVKCEASGTDIVYTYSQLKFSVSP
jgi:hypothetical protein